jgi:hypothetical protein
LNKAFFLSFSCISHWLTLFFQLYHKTQIICKKGVTCKKKQGEINFALGSWEGDFSWIGRENSHFGWLGRKISNMDYNFFSFCHFNWSIVNTDQDLRTTRGTSVHVCLLLTIQVVGNHNCLVWEQA